MGRQGADVSVESTYSIDPLAHLVRMRLGGLLTAEGLISAMRQIAADPRYEPGMHAIADFRECGGSWDYSDIQRFRDFVVQACGASPRRWASVVRPGGLEAVARVLIVISEAVGSRIQIQLFEDLESAYRWVQSEDP